VAEVEDERAKIIDYWRTVELFSPQQVDKVSRDNDVCRVQEGKPLPWEPGHPLMAKRLPRDLVWRHAVYIGTFEIEDVLDILETAFPAASDAYNERRAGTSAVGAVQVAHDGRPLLGSETLSSCAWATGRVLAPGPGAVGWLVGLDRAQLRLSEMCEEMFAIDDDEVDDPPDDLGGDDDPVGRPITTDDLRALLVAVRDIAGLAGARPPRGGDQGQLVSPEIRIKSWKVSRKRAYRGDDSDFLNSFIADDLHHVATAVRDGSSSAALDHYLRPDDWAAALPRIDVEDGDTGLRTVYDSVSPRQVPLGRWPADVDHPLALGQQFAVNQILWSLGDASGVFGVNGPPGTGKTTMLRDLVAAIVVARAERLAALSHPAQAFAAPIGYRTGEHERRITVLQPAITGFEMVVASSNNAAVENVTREIPDAGAIASAWTTAAADLDYHSAIATAVLNADRLDADPSSWDPAWALVAAPLGNRRNCTRFANAFWWGDDGDPKRGVPARPAMRHLVGACASQPPPAASWRTAVEAFQAAQERARALQSTRSSAERDLAGLGPAQRKADEAGAAAVSAHVSADAARADHAARQAALPPLEAALERARARELHHVQTERPGVLTVIVTLGRALARWRAEHAPLLEQTRRADRALEDAHRATEWSAAALAGAEQASLQARSRSEAAQRQLTELTTRVEQAEGKLGRSLPDEAWWAADQRERRELRAPWTDPEWNTARTELLLAALALHEAFTRHAAARLKPGLQTAIDIMSGRASPDLSEEVARAAWQTLFLVVPVVSTTFSSVGRLFSHLGPEALGWLLVDEAGQATPQSAVGAIWRSRRVVAVGDPLQLEPIVSLPFTAEDAIRLDQGVARTWLPSRTSVQQLADRLTPVGTALDGVDPYSPIWVGAPLKVHRRCDEPMFSLVNDLVYSGLMVYATQPKRAPAVYEHLPASAWYDITGGESSGHWIAAEGDQLELLLKGIAGQGIDLDDVIAIAPFRDVANGIETRVRSNPSYAGLVGGTIHRAQGKEADIVILVLGGDPARPGAKEWAASKPNLVNVAVSRARRRIYVVGNREEWRTRRYFGTVAERLRVKYTE
jgi:hypothetical protein